MFRVNAMIQKESVRQRLESEQGISFLEFNYMLLQAYDFYVLCRDHNCVVQVGGQDQYGNITAGVELVHRVLGRRAYGITFPLLTDSSGNKFGKTAAGAIWLDPDRTSPYDYYQFWRNTPDADVERNLALFTTLPMNEIRILAAYSDAQLNRSKEILAYEATRLAHGSQEAAKAWQASVGEFGEADPQRKIETSSGLAGLFRTDAADIPTVVLSRNQIKKMRLIDILVEIGMTRSLGSARRLIRQGGVYLQDNRISDEKFLLHELAILQKPIRLQVGKKKRCLLRIKSGLESTGK